MRESTGEWLAPMLEAAETRTDIDYTALMRQASMPAAEAATPMMDWLARNTPTGATSRAVDWIRYGQLLRAQLGWDDYPEFPEEQS